MQLKRYKVTTRKKAKQIGSNKIGDQKQEGKKQEDRKQEDRKQGSRKPHDAHDIHSTPQFTNTLLANGESRKEILARSRGLLFKFPTQWTKRQETRAKILFAEYPEIKQAYDLIVRFRNIYNLKDREEATHALNTWKNDISASELDELKNFASTVDTHQGEILSYFSHRKTNAYAESLNSHIQRFFIASFGIRNRDFFHFRIKNFFT